MTVDRHSGSEHADPENEPVHPFAVGAALYRNLTKATRIALNVQAHGVPELRVRQRLKL
jgi:hypothetical protein